MKKYKANYMFTIMFQVCSLLTSCLPGITIMWLLLSPNDATVVLYIFPFYIAFILYFTVLSNVINFIISSYTKHTVYIDEKTIIVQGKGSMPIEYVKYVIFDHGTISKSRGNTPCSIVLYNFNYKKCLTITNPSFLLICELQKRLKHATFKFNNYKWYVGFGCGFAVFAALIGLFA